MIKYAGIALYTVLTLQTGDFTVSRAFAHVSDGQNKVRRIGEAINPGPMAFDANLEQPFNDIFEEVDVEGWAPFDEPPQEADLVLGAIAAAAGQGEQERIAEQQAHDDGQGLEEIDELIAQAAPWADAARPSPLERACRMFHEAHGIVHEPTIDEVVLYDRGGGQMLINVTDPWADIQIREAARLSDKWGVKLRGRRNKASSSAGAQGRQTNPHMNNGASGGRAIPREHLPTMPCIEEERHETGGGGETRPQVPFEHMNTEWQPSVAQVGPSKPDQRRPRGKRQRGRTAEKPENVVEVWTFNSSGSPQLKAAMNHASNSMSRPPIAILSQEHHAGARNIADLQSAARRMKWRLAASKAIQTEEGGTSAGVAICTPAHVAAGVDKGAKVDRSPKDSPGRLAMVWIQELVPSGFMAASCYLHTREGATARNLALLSKALGDLKATRCPWLLGLDAQQEPDQFLRWAAPAIERAGAKVFFPKEPTHFPGVGQERCMDFFIVDASIAPAVKEARIISEFRCTDPQGGRYTVAAKPHRAVSLVLHCSEVPRTQTVLKLPKPFDRVKPCGCPRRPIAPPSNFADAIAAAADREGKAQAAGEAWQSVVRCIEAELCGVLDLYQDDGPDQRWSGRGQAMQTAERSTLPRRAAGRQGHMGQDEYAFVWAMNRLTEADVLTNKAATRNGLSDGQGRQWAKIVRKMCSPSSPICEHPDKRWRTFSRELQRLASSPAESRELVRTTLARCTEEVESSKKNREKSKKMAWARWLAQQRKAGGVGGAAHHFAKKVEEDPEMIVRVSGVRSATAQDIVNSDWAEWNSIWTAWEGQATAPWRTEELPQCDLPPLLVNHLRKVALTFKETTGLGIDVISPRHLAWLSDDLLQAVADFLEHLEKAGIWPHQLEQIMFHRIPKAAGGRRPIGILPTIIRLWERARKPMIDEWRRSCRREYNWTEPGRGSEKSVWVQSIREEAARARGDTTASVLVDLVKAFEKVALAHVWERGKAHRFPLQILRLTLESCAFERRLTYRQAVSKTSRSLTAILAGGGFASDLLYVALVDAVDGLIARHEANAYMIADDLRFVVEGKESDVVGRVQQLAEDTVDVLEESLAMEVSRDRKEYGKADGKTVALASSARARKRITTGMRKLGIKVRDKTRNLGVDFAAGRPSKRAGRPVQAKRLAEAKERRERAARMGRPIEQAIISSAVIPSIIYGNTITGITDNMCSTMRAMVASAFGPTAGRSTSVRLLLEEADPVFIVVARPIMQWISAVWDGSIEVRHMADAWKLAAMEVGASARPNSAVTGGAGAYWAALRRVGWTAPTHDTIKMQDDAIVFFGARATPQGTQAMDPSTIKHYLEDEYERKVSMASQLARDINDVAGIRGYPRIKTTTADGSTEAAIGVAYGSTHEEAKSAATWRRGKFEVEDDGIIPWLWPVKRVIRAAKKAGKHVAARSLRALAEGGWRTQRRLWAEGRAAHDKCSCGKTGSLWHKVAECSITQQRREEYCPTWLLRSGKASPWDPLFSRGVPARPKRLRPPKEQCWWEAARGETARSLTGDVYTDGSCKGPFWRTARAGWAAVQIDELGRWASTLNGTLGGPFASSFRAELKAILEALRIAVPPITLHTDNAAVIGGIQKGKEWCTSSKAKCADIWKDIWFYIEELGDDVRFVKVKAHTTWMDVLLGRTEHVHHYGNDLADQAAKAATRAAEADSPAAGANAQLRRALAWMKWLITYVGGWSDDVDPLERQGHDIGDDEARKMARACRKVAGVITHEVWKLSDEMLCRRCGKTARAGAAATEWAMTQCRGSAGGRAAAHATGNVNYIWFKYGVARNSLEQRGAMMVSASAVPRYAIDEQRLHEVARSREHHQVILQDLGLPQVTDPGDAKRRRGDEDAAIDGKRFRREGMKPPESMARGTTRARDALTESSGEGQAIVRRRVEEPPGQDESPAIEAEGKRYRLPWERPPAWVPIGQWTAEERRSEGIEYQTDDTVLAEALHAQGASGQSNQEGGRAHVIAFAGPIAYCVMCARFASERVGSGLKGACTRPLNKTRDAVAARLARLRQGLHPITGRRLF